MGTTAWNATNGAQNFTVSDGVAEFSAEATWAQIGTVTRRIKGHLYLTRCDLRANTATPVNCGFVSPAGNVYVDVTDAWTTVESVVQATTSEDSFVCTVFSFTSGPTLKLYVRNCMLIDLTACFGAGNEPQTVSAARAFFPNAYYPYTLGSFAADASTYTLTDAEQNFNGGTVTLPSLHGIGNFSDTWDAVSGKGLRKIGIASLTGAENWTASGDTKVLAFADAGVSDILLPGDDSLPTALCTQAQIASLAEVEAGQEATFAITRDEGFSFSSGKTLADWKSYLATLNSQGFPLRIAYVRSEAVPFTSSPAEALRQPCGAATISRTGPIRPCGDFEITYITHS